MKSRIPAVLAMAVLFAACSDTMTGPGAGVGPSGQFAQSITLPELDSVLATGPTRVEIKMVNGSLVAREVEVKEAQERTDEEEIESRIIAIDPAGNMTLSLGGLVVSFDGATRFETEGDDHLTMQEFVTRVQNALAAGENPPVEAERNPAAVPQDPNDATFLATKIELDDEADEDEIEINVDSDNFSTNATPPPDAFLTVLNLAVQLDVSGGVTELESENDDDQRDEAEFEGIVESVNGSSVTLTNGTVVQILDDTEIERGDDSDELGSLAEVEQALAAGLLVEAEGEGVVTATNPLTIAASKVEFEIEDDEDDLPCDLEFEGQVTGVDVAARSMTLASGIVVLVANDQLIDPLGDQTTLQGASDALTAGLTVRAEGDAALVDAGPPRVLNALSVKIEDNG